MEYKDIMAVLSLLGVGALLGNYFRILWERQNKAQSQKQEFKETRYKCIIVLLLSILDFEKNKPMLQQHGREYIKTTEDLKDELKREWNNMILFASNEVLVSMHQFMVNPSQQGFRKVAIAMRKDLWGGKISTEEIEKLNL